MSKAIQKKQSEQGVEPRNRGIKKKKEDHRNGNGRSTIKTCLVSRSQQDRCDLPLHLISFLYIKENWQCEK